MELLNVLRYYLFYLLIASVYYIILYNGGPHVFYRLFMSNEVVLYNYFTTINYFTTM